MFEKRPITSSKCFYDTETAGLQLPNHPRFSHGDRSILTNWMLEVCNEQVHWDVEGVGSVSGCMGTDVYFLAVSLYDRYAACSDITAHNSQLTGAACLWIATKFFDWGVDYDAKHMCEVTAGACSIKQLLMQEVRVLKALNFELHIPTAADYMHHLLDANQHPGVAMRSMYFLELYSLAAEYTTHAPRDVAVACIVMGCKPHTPMDYGKLLESSDKKTIVDVAVDISRFHTLFNLNFPPFINDLQHSAIHILYGTTQKLPIVSYAEITRRIHNGNQTTITEHFKKRKVDNVIQITPSMKSSKI